MQEPSTDPPRDPSAVRWLWELPFVGGILAGMVLLWLRGSLFVLDGSVAGYHWPEWLHNAWHVVHGRWDRMSGFRKPLHGYLVGMTGEVLGYDDAATFVASASALVMLLSAGVLARTLAGPAAGGLAAFCLGAVPLVANAAHWGNGYPLLAASTGAALASAALLAARPGRWTLLLATTATIAALASEDRGLLVAPWVAGMVVIAWRSPTRPSAFLFLGALVLTVAVPPAIDAGLGHRAPFALSADEKRVAQKEVVHRWLQIEPDPDLVATCASVRLEDTLEPHFFSTPCARAVLHYNSTTIAPRATFFSGTALGLGILGWLFAVSRRQRTLGWTALATGGLAWVVFATATPMPHRYILQFAVPLVVIVPVAAGRIGRLAGNGWRGWALSTLLCFGTGWWGWNADPHDRRGPWQQSRGNWSASDWADDARLVRAHVPADEAILDCADHGINSAVLPDHVTGPAPFLSPNAGFCTDWVEDPTRFGAARRWISVSTTEGLFDSGKRTNIRLDILVAETSGWRLVAERPGLQLWVRD